MLVYPYDKNIYFSAIFIAFVDPYRTLSEYICILLTCTLSGDVFILYREYKILFYLILDSKKS